MITINNDGSPHCQFAQRIHNQIEREPSLLSPSSARVGKVVRMTRTGTPRFLQAPSMCRDRYLGYTFFKKLVNKPRGGFQFFVSSRDVFSRYQHFGLAFNLTHPSCCRFGLQSRYRYTGPMLELLVLLMVMVILKRAIDTVRDQT